MSSNAEAQPHLYRWHRQVQASVVVFVCRMILSLILESRQEMVCYVAVEIVYHSYMVHQWLHPLPLADRQTAAAVDIHFSVCCCCGWIGKILMLMSELMRDARALILLSSKAPGC